MKRLAEMNTENMGELKSTCKSSTQTLLIHSAFDLPAEQKVLIETAIREILGEHKQIEFVTAADLVSGIEISTEGHKIGWSIDNYLAQLASSVDHLLKSDGRSQLTAEVSDKNNNE